MKPRPGVEMDANGNRSTRGLIKHVFLTVSPAVLATRWKVYILAVFVGIFSGTVAAFFHFLVEKAFAWRLSLLPLGTGYFMPDWFISCLIGMVLVGLSALLVRRLVPEAAGSGVQEVEGALEGVRSIRWWLILPVKFVGGLLAMAAGLVLGREGPTIHMGSSIGAMLSQGSKANREDKDSLIAAGAGAGLAAAFNAPLAGIMFVTEEMRVQFKYTFVSFHAVIIASAVALVVNRMVFGQGPILTIPVYSPPRLDHLIWYLMLGIFMGAAGVVFNKALLMGLDMSALVKKIHPDLLALAVGAMGGFLIWAIPEAMGGGEDLIKNLVRERKTILWLATLVVLRSLTTVGSYSSGVPGGIFAPMLALGTLTGLGYGHVLEKLVPGIDIEAGAFAIAAMGALFAATVRAPLTGIILIAEMTQNYETTLASIMTCVMASLTAQALGGRPIYRMLLERTLQGVAGTATSLVDGEPEKTEEPPSQKEKEGS